MVVGVFLGSGVVTKEATLPAERLAALFTDEVVMIGLTLDPVAGIEPGDVFVPQVTLDQARPTTLLIPGGFGCRPMSQDLRIVDRIRDIATTCDGVLAISTGTLLLAATGLLTGQRAAGHWLTRDELEPFGADLSDSQMERHGRLFTTSGAQAALEAVPLLADVMLYGPVSG
jgi:cyclohexyl-isocyanide hydratase